MATFSLFDLNHQWSLSIERFPLLDYFPIEGNFPLLHLNPILLEKVINKFTMASYLPLQQTCRDMHEFIRSSHNISVSAGRMYADLEFDEGRLRCVTYHSNYLDMEALYGTRLNRFVLPVDSEGFDAICGYLKKYSITCQSVQIYGDMNMWAKEQCVVLLNILKPEKVDHYYIRFNQGNQVSNAFEAIFQVKTLKRVELREWNPDAVAPIANRLLSSFQQVEIYVLDGTTDNTQAYYSLLRILCTQQFPNLQYFNYSGSWAGGIYSFKADIENTLRGLDVAMNIKKSDHDGMVTNVYASIDMPEGVSPRHRISCDIYNDYDYSEEGIIPGMNNYTLSMTMIEETPAVSNPLQGTSASPTVVRPSPSSFISPSNPFSSSVPLSLSPSSSFPLYQSNPLPQYPYSPFTPYPPNPFCQYSPFSPYSHFPPPAVSNPLQGVSASPTVVRPSPSSFISPSNPFSSSVPLSLSPSSSFPLYQSNPLPQYPYSPFTPYPPNPFCQYSPFSPYSHFPPPAVSNPLQGVSASPTVVRPSPSSFISPSNPFSSSVPLSLSPSSSFPLYQSNPLPQYPYSPFTPYPPNPFCQYSPFSPYSHFPPPAVSNPLQGVSASPTVVRPSPSSFISPSNPFSSSVPLSLSPSSSFPLYQSNPLPQYPYSPFTPYPPNPFFQYSPCSPYSRFPLYPPSSFYPSNTLFPPPFSSFPLNPSGPSPLPPPSRLFPSPSNPEGRMSPLNENK